MPTLEAHDITKTFRAGRALRLVLDRVSLDVDAGQTLAVVGPSGAGKTTLLRVLCGLEAADAGRIAINGDEVTHRMPQRRAIALVTQNDALLPHLSIDDNLRLVARNGMHRIDAVSAMLHVNAIRKQKTRTVSGGERQRASLARALLADPSVLLLDEPFAHLDPPLRAVVRRSLFDVRSSFGGPMLLVTHDHLDAMAVATRLAVLIDGRIEQIGEPHIVFERPANVRVAAFLGVPAMNLLPGETFAMPGCIVGIRPERIALASDGAIRVRIERIERAGSDALVTGRDGGVAITVRVDAAAMPRVGETVGLAFDASALLRFDRESGEAL